MPSVTPISRGWHLSFAQLLRSAEQHLLVCSPFISRDGASFVIENVSPTFLNCGKVTLLTNLSVANICQLSTDPRAVKLIADALPKTEVFHLPGLHAKVYVADQGHAIVTSGNLTAGGLHRNYEFGVELLSEELVQPIHSELIDFAELGASVPLSRIDEYCNVLSTLQEPINLAQRVAQQNIRQQFRESLNTIEDDLLRLRLDGGAVHTVFAKTIYYLLRKHGRLTTIQLHPLISAIHPDLCDDSVDRVINGRHFGKKWKHAVRTAQQQLKSEGKIHYDDGTWRLSQDV